MNPKKTATAWVPFRDEALGPRMVRVPQVPRGVDWETLGVDPARCTHAKVWVRPEDLTKLAAVAVPERDVPQETRLQFRLLEECQAGYFADAAKLDAFMDSVPVATREEKSLAVELLETARLRMRQKQGEAAAQRCLVIARRLRIDDVEIPTREPTDGGCTR